MKRNPQYGKSSARVFGRHGFCGRTAFESNVGEGHTKSPCFGFVVLYQDIRLFGQFERCAEVVDQLAYGKLVDKVLQSHPVRIPELELVIVDEYAKEIECLQALSRLPSVLNELKA